MHPAKHFTLINTFHHFLLFTADSSSINKSLKSITLRNLNPTPPTQPWPIASKQNLWLSPDWSSQKDLSKYNTATLFQEHGNLLFLLSVQFSISHTSNSFTVTFVYRANHWPRKFYVTRLEYVSISDQCTWIFSWLWLEWN